MEDASPPLEIELKSGLLKLTLNRPEKGNALNEELVEDLISAFSGQEEIRVCIIEAKGKFFCTGFDLSDIDDLSDGDLLWRFLRIETLLQKIHHAPFPVYVFAQGQAIGAGADIFSACWKRYAAQNAKFKMPGWNFELALGTRRLSRLIGPENSRDMLLNDKTISCETAFEIGLVSKMVDISEWKKIVISIEEQQTSLTTAAINHMFEITLSDSRDADIAAIVKSAGRPGLKNRILSYKKKMKFSKQ